MKLTLNTPGPDLVLLQLEAEYYVQNKGKIVKNNLDFQFSKFLCESDKSRCFHTSNVLSNISVGKKFCVSVWFKKGHQHCLLGIMKKKLLFSKGQSNKDFVHIVYSTPWTFRKR